MSDKNLSGVSVILPAYNEGAAIGETLEALKITAAKLGRPTEIIVVDDGSADDTAQVAQALGVRVLRHPANSGYGRSLLTGIEAAAHDAVLIIDADGTYPIEQLPELLGFFDRGFDMAVGARQGEHYVTSLGNRVLRAIFRFLAEYSCGRSIPDINSGFRVFKRQPVLTWRGSLSTGFSFTTTITLLFMLNNLLVGYMPVDYHKRVGSSKVRLVRDALRSLQIILTAIAQFNPLKLYLLLFVANVFGNGGIAFYVVTHPALDPMLFWCLLAGWNALTVIVGIAILAVAALKPSKTV